MQRRQKTYEGFSRLPEEFTIDDVIRCFSLGSDGSARKKVFRLQRDHLVEKVREEHGTESKHSIDSEVLYTITMFAT